ncbi:hypothetical protein D3C75_1104570 [compost metagenome]
MKGAGCSAAGRLPRRHMKKHTMARLTTAKAQNNPASPNSVIIGEIATGAMAEPSELISSKP